jgi:hypothetical protein
MELLNNNGIISPAQVKLLVLGNSLNEIKNSNILHLEKSGICYSNKDILPLESHNAEIGLSAFESFLRGAIPVSETILDNDLFFLIYGREDVSGIFYPSNENNTSVIGSGFSDENNEFITYKLILSVQTDNLSTAFQTVVTVNKQFQKVEGILVQFQDSETIERCLCTAVVSDSRFTISNFDKNVLETYPNYFDIETGNLKEPDRYSIIPLGEGNKNSKENASVFNWRDIFQYRSLSALGGSSHMVEWSNPSGERITSRAPYGYDLFVFLQDHSTGNFFPVFMLPPRLNLFNPGFSFRYENATDTFSKDISSKATKNKFSPVFPLEDASKVINKIENPLAIEINDWSDVKPYQGSNYDTIYAFVAESGKGKNKKYFLDLLGNHKIEENKAEYIHFPITGQLSGRNETYSSYSSPGMDISNFPFHIRFGLDPLYYTYDTRCIFSFFNASMWKSAYCFLLPDGSLLFGISVNGNHNVFRSKRRLMPYKLSLVTLNVDFHSVENWCLYLNGSRIECEILINDGFSKNDDLSDLTDLFFLIFPDVNQENIFSALESGIYSPGNFTLTDFTLGLGYDSLEKHIYDYQYGIRDSLRNNFRNLISFQFTDFNYGKDRIFCKVTGHPASVHNA